MFDAKTMKLHIKNLWGAHYYLHHSRDPVEIAKVICISPKKMVEWMQLPRWQEAIEFWGGLPKREIGDLKAVGRLWESMIECGIHETPEKIPEDFCTRKQYREYFENERGVEYPIVLVERSTALVKIA